MRLKTSYMKNNNYICNMKNLEKEKIIEVINEITNAMERWHLARYNDDETLQNINDVLVSIGLLEFFNKKEMNNVLQPYFSAGKNSTEQY